jgi:hypothetical protein
VRWKFPPYVVHWPVVPPADVDPPAAVPVAARGASTIADATKTSASGNLPGPDLVSRRFVMRATLPTTTPLRVAPRRGALGQDGRVAELHVLIAGCVLVLIAGLGGAFVFVRRRRFAISMRATLADPDATTRTAALEIVERQGAERFLPTLLWRSRVETDPTLRTVLARVLGPEDDTLLAVGADIRRRQQAARRYIRAQQHRLI